VAAIPELMAARWHHQDACFPQRIPTGPDSEEGGATITREASTRSIEAQLRQAGRRIDGIVAAARRADHHITDRISRRVDRLRAHEAQARTRLRELRRANQIAWDEHALEMERRLDELSIEMAIAEARLKAELTTDSKEFAAAVQAELIAWNTYIDALQATAATSQAHARPRREAVIRRVRQRRGNVRQQLQEYLNTSGNPSVILRIRIGEALDGLDQAVGDAAAEFEIACNEMVPLL
jgi:hypothetical protein